MGAHDVNANEIRVYERVLELVKEHKMRFELSGESFFLYRSDKKMLGGFRSLDQVHFFLLGYDWGRQKV